MNRLQNVVVCQQGALYTQAHFGVQNEILLRKTGYACEILREQDMLVGYA
jgi:hypothetical protein